jgi:hypothetical protein
MANQLAIQLIAEEKVKFQRLQKEQEILIQKQQEKFQLHQNYSGYYWYIITFIHLNLLIIVDKSFYNYS